MGKVFFVSDCHFGHEKVIQFDNRPFESIQQIEEIIERYETMKDSIDIEKLPHRGLPNT